MIYKTIQGNAIVLTVLLAVSANCLAARPLFGHRALPGESQSPAAITPGPATQLVLLQQPSNALTQAVIAPTIRVAIEDANGNVVPSANQHVRVNLTGIFGLGGTLEVSARKGIATFNDLAVNTAGNYTLYVSSPGLTSATSTVFTIGPPVSTTNGTTIMQTTPLSLNASPGGIFQITYNWQAVPVEGRSSVFVNFVDSTGKIQFQDNAQPPVPTSQWTGPVSYAHSITVPPATAPGNYTVIAGLDSSTGNISLVTGPGVTSVANGAYQVGTLTLVPTCSITSFGAVGDSVTNNATAIQNTFNYAASHNCTALIPAGVFAYSGLLTATSIAVAGTGASSILKAQNTNDEALVVAGNGGLVSNLQMQGIGTARLAPYQAAMIWVNGAHNFTIQNVLINGGSGVGIFDAGGQTGLIQNNTVENTLADSITNTNGASYVTVKGNRVLHSGDDGVSNNSYTGDGSTVNHITVEGNTILGNAWGRGLEVSGGSSITFAGNYVDNLDGYTDMYIAAEGEWNTQSVSNVTVTGNTFVDGGPNQGSSIVYNSQGGATIIAGITITGNQFVNPKLSAIQFAGDGVMSGIAVQNNNDYSDAPTGFSFSSNTNPGTNYTETGNQVLAPSSYTTPLVSSGGGCNFAGC